MVDIANIHIDYVGEWYEDEAGDSVQRPVWEPVDLYCRRCESTTRPKHMRILHPINGNREAGMMRVLQLRSLLFAVQFQFDAEWLMYSCRSPSG